MAMYTGEEDVWKCLKHPSKRHRTGVCPVCLRDRLIVLCPECANKLPCLCYASGSSSSSASSSSSFSLFSFSSRDGGGGGGGGGRVSELIDREPAFRRSRSVGIPYIFSRFADERGVNQRPEVAIKSKIAAVLSKLKTILSRKRREIEKIEDDSDHRLDSNVYSKKSKSKLKSKSCTVDDFARVMMKSRSVHLPADTPNYANSPATVKNRRRSFRTPMRFFRHVQNDSTSATTA